MEEFSGIVNINKPGGITSFDVVSRVRRLFKIKKVGHCGTLDPFATGVLPVCVGKATSAVRYMDNYDKKYRVKIVFGKKTDTQDRTGKIIRETNIKEDVISDIKKNDFASLRDAVCALKERKKQVPPMYSAIKIDGTPLYKLARQGIEIERRERDIEIYKIDVLNINTEDELSAILDIHCSKGTYIRTICDDIGDMTGLYAYAHSLERTGCGPFCIEHSVTTEKLEEILNLNEKNKDLAGIYPGIEDTGFALADYPEIELGQILVKRLIQGQKIPVNMEYSTKPLCVFDQEGKFIGVARFLNNTRVIKAERIFADVQNYI